MLRAPRTKAPPPAPRAARAIAEPRCSAHSGKKKYGRCKECRAIISGKTPKAKPGKKTKPSAGKEKKQAAPAKADAAPTERSGPVSAAWVAAFKALVEQKPTIVSLWGVSAVVRLLASGGKPFYEKLPPALREEVIE